MNILITGAAGFIGSHLAERLADLNHSVTGIDCLLNNYSTDLKQLNIRSIKKKGVQFHPVNLTTDDLKPFLKNTDFVFHLAAQPGIDVKIPFETYLHNNIIATKKLITAVKQSTSVRGFVNIATSSVYGINATGDENTEPQPISDYGVTKLAAEQLVMSEARNGNLNACSLRLFSVYGPRERPEKLYHKLIKCMLSNVEFSLYEGSDLHIRSYTFVDDIIDGMVAVLENFEKCNGEIFNLGTDKTITTAEGIKIIEEILGKKANINIVPKRLGDQHNTHANITKAKKFFGYNPTTEPFEGLKAEVDWYNKNLFQRLID